MKDIRSQGGLSSADISRTRGNGGVFRCGLPHCLVQKNFGISKFMACQAKAEDLRIKAERFESVRAFCEQGRGVVSFSRFCADVFYGRPLMMLYYTAAVKIIVTLETKLKLFKLQCRKIKLHEKNKIKI